MLHYITNAALGYKLIWLIVEREHLGNACLTES